jgi:hypothetical protein
VAEALYARRHAPHLQGFMDWSALDAHRVEPPRDEDAALIEAIVRRHEGEPALRWTRHWWRRQRDAFRLFRATDGGACDGFCAMLRLRAPLPGEDRADPAVAAAFAFVAAQRPLAAGKERCCGATGITVGNDRQMAPGGPHGSALQRLRHAWVRQVLRAGHDDAQVAAAFLRVARLLDAPARLLAPALAARVLLCRWRQTRRAGGGVSATAPAPDRAPARASTLRR